MAESNGEVRDGVWVRYRTRKGPLTRDDYVSGVGKVLFMWWYDGVWVEIDSISGHGRVSIHCDATYTERDGIRVPDGWNPSFPGESINVIPEPAWITEGVGL